MLLYVYLLKPVLFSDLIPDDAIGAYQLKFHTYRQAGQTSPSIVRYPIGHTPRPACLSGRQVMLRHEVSALMQTLWPAPRALCLLLPGGVDALPTVMQARCAIGMTHCKDLTPIPSPKERGNTDDRSDDHSEGFASIFEFPSPLGKGVGARRFGLAQTTSVRGEVRLR